MIFKNNETVIFFGDSITDCGTNKPSGEGAPVNNPYGNGYVALLHACLTAKYPEIHLRIINKGISGHRSIDLVNRLESDVISYKPNWLVIMIGINDVWRLYDSPNNPDFRMDAQDYQRNLINIIERSQKEGIKIILCTPYFIESNKKDELRMKMDVFSSVCIELANKYSLLLVNTQKAFDKVLKNITCHELARDRIHPNYAGHYIIMNEILKTLEKS